MRVPAGVTGEAKVTIRHDAKVKAPDVAERTLLVPVRAAAGEPK